ncbi:MAG TPA: hemerythrin domain-containing protein [Baekduia sp.]|nr:hemerythrin domain-containing protein [Baekduia sp.]
MKRSPALAPLSRDHQHALDAALRLRRAEPGTLAAAIAHFGAFFADEGRAHFAIEEEHLLDALPAADDEWAPAVARVRDDHAAIRGQADALATGTGHTDLDAARALGQRLNDHVRFEERVLFEILERRLPPSELEALGAAVAAAEAEHGA